MSKEEISYTNLAQRYQNGKVSVSPFTAWREYMLSIAYPSHADKLPSAVQQAVSDTHDKQQEILEAPKNTQTTNTNIPTQNTPQSLQ